MNFINMLLGYPLGLIMWLFYTVIPNYGLALILFTIAIKLILFPLAVKQQKSTVKMAMFRPKLETIQKKYANNKEKLNEEMMKLYQEEKYNPMSGCLPMLIQFPILFGLIDVVYKPLTHVLRLKDEFLTPALATAKQVIEASGGTMNVSAPQLSIVTAIHKNMGEFSSFDPAIIDKILNLDLNFLGMNLAENPTFAWNLLIIIPILSGVTSLLVSLLSLKSSSAQMGDNAAGGGMMKGMMLIMPIFSTVFTFQVPAGVGLYWIVSNVAALIQQKYLYKKYDPVKTAEIAKQAEEEEREKRRLEKMEAKKLTNENPESADEELKKKALSQKEKNRLKLAEARKKDAEKYGEEYVEVTDDDLK